MSLRTLAEQDLAVILEGDVYGARWPVTVTNPQGLEDDTLYGFSNDISQAIDPETGQLVSGRFATVALRIAQLTAAGFAELPRHVSDSSRKPWIVKFNDINGLPYTFKVRRSDPDRGAGLIVCTLEEYTP